MSHYVGIPSISLQGERPGPWGNSPDFFCKLFEKSGSVRHSESRFKEYVMDIIYNGRADYLMVINSFLTTIRCDFHIDYCNGDIEKIGDQFDFLSQKLEDNEDFRHNFIEAIYEHIIDKVPHRESEQIRLITKALETGYIDLSAIANEISCMDVVKHDPSPALAKVFGRKI